MEKKIYCCDVCGKEYISPESIRVIHIDNGTGDLQTHARRDICLPCFSKICEYVHTELEEWNNN